MSRLKEIISETIESYIKSNVLCEEEESDSRVGKKTIKLKGNLRREFNKEDEKKHSQKVDDEEQSSIEEFLLNGSINIASIARELYPDHTPEGAQSELLKKLKREKSDSGSEYRLTKDEVKKLRQIIAKLFNR